jgi:CDP-ribitol ribitolphosphotransferase
MNEKKRKGKVAIISRESDERTLDIALLEDELNRRGIETETLTKLFTKDNSGKAAAEYLKTVAKQQAAIARADVVVLDTYCIAVSMLPHIGRTKIIQMWHALSAVKKFGWQTVGSEDGTSERTATLMRMHKGYDYVISASDATSKHFAEAFRIDPSKIVKLGLPRIDYILSATHGDGRYKTFGAIYALYPELAQSDRKIVLYAPTFRKGSMPDVKGLADALDPEKYTLIVRLHPLYREETEMPQGDNIIYIDDMETFDLLGVADIIISDYSSLVVEGTLADTPMYLYTYDIDSYSETTGLNVNFGEEAIGKYAFRDAAKLAAALEKPYDMEALRAFRDKYIEVDTENCTGQLADFIESLLPGTAAAAQEQEPTGNTL